jgi:activating signal cointegrator 1
VKAITLTQPWATLVALELKRWETRGWPTAYRGPIAIHAAKGFPCGCKEFGEELRGRGLIQELPLGSVVAVADLTDCRGTLLVQPLIDAQEEEFGDYSSGRYAFHLENVRALRVPIPVRGALMLWDLPVDVEAAVRNQLEAAA